MSKENHLYYKPTKEGIEKIEKLRLKVIELDDLIDSLVRNTFPQGKEANEKNITDSSAAARSYSISKTKLEECRMRAVEAIVRLHNDGAV